MRLNRLFGISLFCAGIAAVFPVRTYGAAQLAAGAKTSAQPTATNPQQRQLQITFDPETEGGNGPYNVTSFQLSSRPADAGQAAARERRNHSSNPMRPSRASPNGTSERSSTKPPKYRASGSRSTWRGSPTAFR